jgi:hypothetical protein
LGSDCQHQKSILVILREKGNVLKEWEGTPRDDKREGKNAKKH